MGKIILIIFAIMFSPCLLRFLPDPKPKAESRQPLAEEEAPEVPFCDVPPAMTEKQRKAELARQNAAADLEFIEHQMKQTYELLEITELNQAGTVHGGKEWLKFQKQIISYENKMEALRKRKRKAMSILAS